MRNARSTFGSQAAVFEMVINKEFPMFFFWSDLSKHSECWPSTLFQIFVQKKQGGVGFCLLINLVTRYLTPSQPQVDRGRNAIHQIIGKIVSFSS